MRLIDADELKKAMLRENTWWENADVWIAHIVIDNAPTVKNKVPTIEQKRGIWLPRNSGFLYWVRCSVCDEKLYGYQKCDFEFCPYCGARMEG